jgi:hypothetical protein
MSNEKQRSGRPILCVTAPSATLSDMWRGLFVGFLFLVFMATLNRSKKLGWRYSIAMLLFVITIAAVLVGIMMWDLNSHVAPTDHPLPG